MIDPGHPSLSIQRQCELLDLPRSSYYYQAQGEDAYNLELMRLIDEQYTRRPFFGIRRMTDSLRRQGHQVNHKRVGRLMRLMGLQAIHPKPKTSQAHLEHRKYPYLLRGLVINRPDQVWCSDVTYIRLVRGFLYLVAVMDWYSRYVLAWRLSNTLDASFCIEALEEALSQGQPKIFNTDQGVQFTSTGFTSMLQEAQVRISMDGRGRCFDNIMVERLWRSVKYEEVYLKDYQQVADATRGLGDYFPFYNRERGHQSLDYRTPYEVYHGLGWGAGDGLPVGPNSLTISGSKPP
jgi:putative transposase